MQLKLENIINHNFSFNHLAYKLVRCDRVNCPVLFWFGAAFYLQPKHRQNVTNNCIACADEQNMLIGSLEAYQQGQKFEL